MRTGFLPYSVTLDGCPCLSRSDRLRLFALLLWALPLPPSPLASGGWQNGAMPYWLAATLAFSAAATVPALGSAGATAAAADAQTPQTPSGRPSRRLGPIIEAMAEGIRPEDWPSDGPGCWPGARCPGAVERASIIRKERPCWS
jgi:hypothetical protein